MFNSNNQQKLPALQSDSSAADTRMVAATTVPVASITAADVPMPLRNALASQQPDLINRSILKADPDALLQQVWKRKALEDEIESLRKKYKGWVDLFNSPTEQQTILTNIANKGNALKAQLSSLAIVPTLGESSHDDRTSEAETLTEIGMMVLWADRQINTSKPLTEDQVVTISEAILQEYRHLRLEDIAAAFRRAIMHTTTPTMRMDTQVVMGWMLRYDQERTERLLKQAENDHLTKKWA